MIKHNWKDNHCFAYFYSDEWLPYQKFYIFDYDPEERVAFGFYTEETITLEINISDYIQLDLLVNCEHIENYSEPLDKVLSEIHENIKTNCAYEFDYFKNHRMKCSPN